MTENNKQFEQVPKDFLAGIFIVPVNFDDPENPKHAKYVHEQTKYDLFYDAYDKITNIEMKYLKGENDYFKLKKITDCKGEDSWVERFLTKRHVKEEEDNLLRCEEWIIDRNGKAEEMYKVKTYHSSTDRFFTLIFPNNFRKYFHLYRTRGGII